jgi:uncharacterized protein
MSVALLRIRHPPRVVHRRRTGNSRSSGWNPVVAVLPWRRGAEPLVHVDPTFQMPFSPELKRPPLVRRRSPLHGWGVFATDRIRAGSRLLEYRGERISSDEADARYPEDPSVPAHTFLFAIDDGLVVDATHRGGMARWINHSCDPNCETVVEDRRIYVDAIRELQPGEELTISYNLLLAERHTPSVKRRYACACGADNCRGTMLAPKRRSHR